MPRTPRDDASPQLDQASDEPSKTQAKKQSHELQSLGADLAELSAARLARLDIPERLRDAIEQYQRTRSHEGRRRQMQYVGKLMRGVDEAPLREAVAEAALGSAQETLLLHHAEHWRDQLLADDDALTRWQQAHAECDAQQLRSLVRAARREAALPVERRNPRSYRDLFQFIKPFLEVNP
jgi:ribosome-associated protein